MRSRCAESDGAVGNTQATKHSVQILLPTSGFGILGIVTH